MISISASFAPFSQPLVSLTRPAVATARPRRPPTTQRRQRVVVVGGGKAADRVVQGLRKAPVDVVLIPQRGSSLIQQLTLDQPNAKLVLGDVAGIDTASRRVFLDQQGARQIDYDTLVVATEKPEDQKEGRATNERIRLALDFAESEPDPAERRRLLTFVVIGGGPVGVELARSVASTAWGILADEDRSIPDPVRVVLVEAGPRLMPDMSASFAARQQLDLEQNGVEIRVGAAVTEVAADHVVVGGERIEARTALWAAEADAPGMGRWLAAQANRRGRVEVTDRLTLPGDPTVFVVGPEIAVRGENPHTRAPRGAAKQQGAYVARSIRRALGGRGSEPFRYSLLSRLGSIAMWEAGAAWGPVGPARAVGGLS